MRNATTLCPRNIQQGFTHLSLLTRKVNKITIALYAKYITCEKNCCQPGARIQAGQHGILGAITAGLMEQSINHEVM